MLIEPGSMPTSLIDGGKTRAWRHIPGDHRRREARESYDVFWDDANQFGMVHPRATDARETLIYYETTDDAPYYTHNHPRGSPEPSTPPPFLPRLLVHLAWRVDRGAGPIEQELDRLCRGRRLAILDAGCGTGHCLASCRERGHSVVGFEPDRVPREAAQAQGLEVHDGTCEQLPAAILDRSFDVIICSHALHHVIDPELGLRNLADRLVKGGRLICEVPNQECVAARWAGIACGALDVPRQLNVFTAQSLTRMLERVSLDVQEVQWTWYCNLFFAQGIEHEMGKYDFFKKKGSGREALPVKPSLLSRYALLARTLVARPQSKYPAVRVVAQKP